MKGEGLSRHFPDGIHELMILCVDAQERGQLRLRFHQLHHHIGGQGALLLPAELPLESARLQEGDQDRPGHATGVSCVCKKRNHEGDLMCLHACDGAVIGCVTD